MDPMKLAETVVALVLGAVVTWCVARINRMGDEGRDAAAAQSRREDALDAAVRTLLRSHIVDAYDVYVLGDKPMSVERRQELDSCYQAYHALGGNGTGTGLYEEICKVPVKTFYGQSRKDKA